MVFADIQGIKVRVDHISAVTSPNKDKARKCFEFRIVLLSGDAITITEKTTRKIVEIHNHVLYCIQPHS